MDHKIYVARRRAKFKGCNGQQVNIPYGSILEAQDGFLLWKGQPLCVDTSQNAHDFFSQNDDDQGQERGALVAAILSRLAGVLDIDLDKAAPTFDDNGSISSWASEDMMVNSSSPLPSKV